MDVITVKTWFWWSLSTDAVYTYPYFGKQIFKQEFQSMNNLEISVLFDNVRPIYGFGDKPAVRFQNAEQRGLQEQESKKKYSWNSV